MAARSMDDVFGRGGSQRDEKKNEKVKNSSRSRSREEKSIRCVLILFSPSSQLGVARGGNLKNV